MVPLELKLNDFRSYGEPQTINFRGINRVCIIGRNGSGKSTLISAIMYALFGEKEQKLKGSLVRTGAKSAKVDFTFSALGRTYRVVRIIKKGTGEASLYHIEDDNKEEVIADKTVQVNKTITEILGMDYESFVTASVILQGQSDRFSAMKPTDRKEFFSNVLGLNICEEIAKIARAKSRDFEIQRKYKDEEAGRICGLIVGLGDVNANLEGALERFETAKSKEVEAKKNLDSVRKEIEKLNSIIAEIRAIEERIEDKKSGKERIEKELQTLDSQINRFEQTVTKKGEIESRAKEHSGLLLKEKELSAIGAAVLTAKAKISAIENTIEKWKGELRTKIAELKTARTHTKSHGDEILPLLNREKNLSEKHLEFNATQIWLASLRKKNEEGKSLEKKIAEIEKEIAKEESRLGALLGEKRNRASEFDGKIKKGNLPKIEKDLEKQEAEILKIENLNPEKDKVAIDGQALKGRIEALNAEEKNLNAELETLREKISILENALSPECPLCGQSLSREHKEKVFDEHRGKMNDATGRIADIEKTRAEYGNKIEELMM